MARRNLQREARHLMPRPVTTGSADRARQQARLMEAVTKVVEGDAILSLQNDEAVRAGVRLVFDQLVERGRIHWIGGVPTRADLAAVERRVGSLLGLSTEQVTEALTGHPRPATAG